MSKGPHPGPDVARILGLHPAAAMLAVAADWALFGSTLFGYGLGMLLAFLLGLPITVAVTLLQRSLYGDGLGLALGKGLGVALLVGVPTPVFSTPVVVSGILGGLTARRRAVPTASGSAGAPDSGFSKG